ncbi:hypothetical protein ACFQ1M_01445 [Sungkyunkwania multivorans]|uniref:Uncharacterized protein n=1 Tax=Sungkyunkwania multivorans TaxID=1173618 RepID=A0ABW3CUX4_9FLAO
MEKSLEEIFDFKNSDQAELDLGLRQRNFNTLEERLSLCKVCLNKKVDFNKGLLCGLSLEKPAFTTFCESYEEDTKAIEKLAPGKVRASKGKRIILPIVMSLLGFIRAVIRLNEESIYGWVFFALGIAWLLSIILDKEE